MAAVVNNDDMPKSYQIIKYYVTFAFVLLKFTLPN